MRTLLSYCSVHGSQGGGLASVRMELILLLQELQQDRRFTTGNSSIDHSSWLLNIQIYAFTTFLFQGGSESALNTGQPHLSSPLAYPTSLPLLAASVAGMEIITTDPVRHLEVSFERL